MKLPVIEPQAAVFILCINFVRIIPAHPYPKSDGLALPQCGSETCDTHKRPIPEFCNRVELRCESCSVRTCEEVICVEWNGCANTTPPIPIAISTRGPETDVQNDEITKSSSELDRRETEMQRSLDKLNARVDHLNYGFYGLCVLMIAFLISCGCKWLYPRCKSGPRGSPSGYHQADPDETIPMTVHSSADSGIQEPGIQFARLENLPGSYHDRIPHQTAWSGQTSRVASDEEIVSRDVPVPPSGVTESQCNGKPTAMAT